MPQSHRRCQWLLALPLASLTLAAPAHVTLETGRAEAGTSFKAVLRAGHGCEGSPIRELIVPIPAGARGAKPMLERATPSTSAGRPASARTTAAACSVSSTTATSTASPTRASAAT